MAMKFEINLSRYQWYIRDQIMVTGFCWLGNKYSENEPFLNEVKKNSVDFNRFAMFCDQLNGQFSVAVKHDGEIWLHTGHTWSFPLFYSITGDNARIGDNPGEIKDKNSGLNTSQEAADYFTAFGVTPGASTLHKSIQLVKPGETVCINLSNGHIHSCMRQFPEESVKDISPSKLASIIRKNFAKYADYLKNRQVLLPLTSGYDSRLLACLLKESGVENVICATWGRINNSEVETARKIAEKLDYQYIFVPYTNDLIRGFAHSDEFEKYAAFAGHYTSMPFLQDFFAIKYLKENRFINEETVVLPGHPGDFLRGSHLYPSLKSDSSFQVAKSVFQAFGSTLPLSSTQKKHIFETIEKQIFKQHSGNRENFDRWDYEERQCKFIGNSSQVYSFYNIPFLTPLFDKDLFNTMLSLPIHQRLFATLYNKTLESIIFSENAVDFNLKTKETGFKKPSWLKKLLLWITPGIIKKRYYTADDNVFYKEVTSLLMTAWPVTKYKQPVKPNRYNGYIIQWYMNWLK
jgi:asparagine synthase (glutamine-hydrolysing)